MALIDELKLRRNAAYNTIEQINGRISEEEASLKRVAIGMADLDRAIAALEPAPVASETADVEVPEGFVRWEGADVYTPTADTEEFTHTVEVIFRDGIRSTGKAWTYVWPWVAEDKTNQNIIAYRILPAEQAGEEGNEPSEFTSDLTGDPAVSDDGSVYGTDAAYEDGVEARLQNVPIECNPGEGIDAERWTEGWNAEDAASKQTDAELLAELDEPTELDAPASIVDDPELQAAVARAEATLAAEPAAYVGLNDPELDAEYDAMRARERSEKSFWGLLGKRKLEDA
jgi:hypothetical protein